MHDSALPPFEPHRAAVYRWAYRVLASHHDALDVTQDVALRWCRLGEHEHPQHPLGWLRRVTVNRAVDLLRSRRPITGLDERQPAPNPGVLRLVEADELRTAVAAAIADLSDAQGAVLIAKVYDNLTFARIAEELEISTSTAKTHYLRALAAVRDKLQPHADLNGRLP